MLFRVSKILQLHCIAGFISILGDRRSAERVVADLSEIPGQAST
jgi:hypothetical protein